MPEASTAAKYAPFAQHLRAVPEEQDELVLGFGDVDRLVGGLPADARQDRTWWANVYDGGGPQTEAWMGADWRVLRVDRSSGRVTFVRAASERWQERAWERRADVPHAWVVRPDPSQRAEEPDIWVRDGYCEVAVPGLGSLGGEPTRREIADHVAKEYGHLGYGSRAAVVTTLNSFLNVMQVGDLVVTLGGDKGDEVYVGTIVGDPEPAEAAGGLTARRRAVDWANARRPLHRDGLPGTLPAKLKGQRTVTELTSELAVFRELVGLREAPAARSTQPVQAAPRAERQARELRLPGATAGLAEGLLLDRVWLQRTIDLLADRKQLVFYGPPGTGKTYVAKRLAEHLARASDVTVVQFHPSYAYEDFFEGFRPQRADGTGQVVFDLAHGPFRRLVERAREDESRPFVLVIDEINRANLAKVFGELYFLLEYRDEPIELLYSPADGDFRLPRNVFLIGTMNTADRSIALVDTAMRRRFAFRAFYPDREPVRGLLRAWLTREGLPVRVAALLDELNRRIGEPDYAIGPSYLMRRDIGTPEGRALVWETAILPLLDEHFHGQGRDVDGDFGLAAIEQAVPEGPRNAAPAGDGAL